MFSLEFKDLNNTKVTIPEEAKLGMDFEKYMSENTQTENNMFGKDTMFYETDMFNQDNMTQFNY